jgi:hypothetical protein
VVGIMSRSRSLITNLLIGISFGFSLAVVIYQLMEPDCPTEDSCTVDYRDGEWHIEETRP